MTDQVIDTPQTEIEKTAEPAPAAAVSPQAEAAPKAQAQAATILATDEKSDTPVASPATWPEDWRAKLAGQDKADLKTLERMKSVEDLWKANKELRAKMASGEKPGLPENATPEDIAAFRKENGIPEKPDGYEIKLASGTVPGAEDKPALDSFRAFAHANHVKPAEFNAMLDWYYTEQEQTIARQQEADNSFRQTATDELRAEWGPEYRQNINAVKNFLSATASDDLSNQLLGARLADGSLLGSHPEALRWLVDLARDRIPGAGLMPAGTPNVGKGIEDRISAIEKVMRTDRAEYYSDQKLQDELRDLYAARDKMKARAA